MKKPLWAELVSLFTLILLLVGCGTVSEELPMPEPSIVVTVKETNKKSSIEIIYSHHQDNRSNSDVWVKTSFSSAEEVEAYRKQLEFAVVKFKEAEEKMKSVAVPKENTAE